MFDRYQKLAKENTCLKATVVTLKKRNKQLAKELEAKSSPKRTFSSTEQVLETLNESMVAYYRLFDIFKTRFPSQHKDVLLEYRKKFYA